MQPQVSVILPVFNCEKYIFKSVTSILNQTFKNLECIIIDDCSTDNTIAVIETIDDDRIRLIRKKHNTGYVESLNMGIREAKGKYIARMDADDISLPERLAKQVDFLDHHQHTAVVATKIKLIDENDVITGNWKNDQLTHTSADIISYLPKGNCLCHPSMMIQRSVLEEYTYDTNQYGSEDWDLWLRLIANGYVIEKLPEVLLHYRITTDSVSATIDRSIGVLQKANRVRKKYLIKRLRQGRFNRFDLRVTYYLLHTNLRIIKQNLTSILRSQ
jgi:glycosyltransferase involved in cell wall biosynthesis